MRIFALDSSSQALVLCYTDEQDIVTLTYKGIEKHASVIGTLAREFLNCTGRTPQEIDCFGCGIGPGSLTGLRIGIAFIQGMACSLQKHVVPVASSELIARNFPYHRGEIVISKRAREGYVYISSYKQNHQLLSPCIMDIKSAEEFIKRLNDPLIAGDAKHYFENFGTICSDEFEIINGQILATQVLLKAKTKDTVEPHQIEPLYLQKSIAEMNFEKNHH